MLFVSFLIFVLFLFIFLSALDARKPDGFPPGPSWFPVIGCHLEIKKLTRKFGFHHLVWEELCRIFGPVVGLRLGRDRIVLVSGQSLVKQVLTREEFDARPDGFFFRMRSYRKRLGVVFVEGNHFLEQKRFCVTALKKLGMGKKVMENIMMKEAQELVESINKQRGEKQLFQMNNIFDIAVLNSLWALMAGERFELDDEKLSELLELVHESFRMLDMSGGVLNQMPFLRFFAPDATGYSKIRLVLERFESFLEQVVLEHKRNLSDEPGNLIDLFLQEMNNRAGETETSFTDEQLIVLLLDLFMAGSETTSNNLSMAMLYMVTYPEVQRKVHDSLDLVVSPDRLPSLQDRPRLGYVEAVLLEVQRHATVVPVAVAHRTTKDVSFQGFVIPKDATVLVDLRSVMMDVAHWGDPDTFRPERFLDSSGHVLQDEWFIPFGQGKRRCLGEGLARPNMFLLFAAIMHNFDVSRAERTPSLVPQDGITLSPQPFHANIQPRTRQHCDTTNA